MSYLTYKGASVVPFDVDNIRLSVEATPSRALRVNVAQFGDGYEQIALDGLNNVIEKWSCRTVPMSANEAWGLESFILSRGGQAFQWTPPDTTKSWIATFASGSINTGYKNLASCTLSGYTNPTNYTVDLTNGIISSVTIADGTNVTVNAVLADRYYRVNGEWTVSELATNKYVISFELKRVYV